MTTSAMIGEFRDNPATRAEFMAHINRTNGSSMF
jgi:GTP cyclohydrolase I